MTNGYVVCKPSNVRVLNVRIVKIVEVVQNDDSVSGGEQLLNQMRADETRSACDENSHTARS